MSTTNKRQPMAPSRWCSIDSPRSGAPAALGIISVHGPARDIDAALRSLDWPPVAIGAIALRRSAIAGEIIVARPSADHAFLTPLGSRRAIDSLLGALRAAGFEAADAPDPRERYPEAADLIEACALDAIARAASPRAIDAILAQRDIWRAAPAPPFDPHARALEHLLVPPRVVVVGRPNIGKSTLLNAMAGRSIAIAADEPGTTRDHLGADVDCDGLRIHWIDTPGIPAPGTAPASDLDREAIARARALLPGAHAVVLAVDPLAGAVDPAELPALPAGIPVVRLGTRSDLGAAAPPLAVATSAVRRAGLEELARILRTSLVPDAALTTTVRWRFHPALPTP
jgi:tRNA modification GTPase